ncbi:MAG TPA: ATP-binding protein, partial [Candidatus Omnitrophota bacterium]|nr:ATP-binding protein [Candidatus Omnitrophota bacterium]
LDDVGRASKAGSLGRASGTGEFNPEDIKVYRERLIGLKDMLERFRSGVSELKASYESRLDKKRNKAARENIAHLRNAVNIASGAIDIIQSRIDYASGNIPQDTVSLKDLVGDISSQNFDAGTSINIPKKAMAVRGNRITLASALYNIVKNGSDFSYRSKKSQALVEIGASEGSDEKLGECVVIEIKDNGGGIQDDRLLDIDPGMRRENIFNINVTEHPGDMKPGTGLGMTEAWYAISDSGGRIEIENRPGEGVTFRIYLPLAAKEPKKTMKAKPAKIGLPDEGMIVTETNALLQERAAIRELNGAVINVIVVKNDESRLAKLKQDDSTGINTISAQETDIRGKIERRLVRGRNARVFYVDNIKAAIDMLSNLKGDTFAFVESSVARQDTPAYEALKKKVFVQDINIPENSICSVAPLGFLLYGIKMHDILARIEKGRAGGQVPAFDDLDVESLARIILINKGLEVSAENVESEAKNLRPFIDGLLAASDPKLALLSYSGKLSVWDLPKLEPKRWSEITDYFDALEKVYTAA